MGEISAERLERDIEVIARLSEWGETSAEVGYSRPTFSEAWGKARDYVMEEARRAGCRVRVDTAGNVHARPEKWGWEERLWLSGSHIDSVPTGGKFDGVVGVVAALEVLRAMPGVRMEMIIFAEEEGTTFGLGMLGSRAWAGTLLGEELGKLRNKDGKSPLEVGPRWGLTVERFGAEQLVPDQYKGLIELHVEQGVAMWDSGIPVAVVTAINGRRQYACTLMGTANHAGSTKMGDRADALAGAAEIINDLEALGLSLHQAVDHTVITVGRLEVVPNAVNVIAGRVAFTIDFRARTQEMLDKGDKEIRQLIAETADRRKLRCELMQTDLLPAVPMDAGVCDQLKQAAAKVGVALPEVTSGALHDAAVLAPLLPTAMLFIASRDGISHNPAESSRIEDVALATRILAEAVGG
jgi:hydantoinase/carbamoylase family amidase